jgi:predicted HTH domain antitoxin
MKLAFELELPDGAVDQSAGAELVRSVKEQAALKLYSEQRITTGLAAEMLGLTRIEFLELLRRSA